MCVRAGPDTYGKTAFFACALDGDHLWRALAYVDRNPVRAGMVRDAGEYRWSSAGAHAGMPDRFDVLDMDWWRGQGRAETWPGTLGENDAEGESRLRRCTHAGRPCGGEVFLEAMSERFQRRWVIGRPRNVRTGDWGAVAENGPLQRIAQ